MSTEATEPTTPPADYAIADALAAAQAELRDPPRAKEGQIRGRRGYRYAGLDDLLGTVRPVLARHGIAIVQPVELRDGQLYLISRLIHGSGDTLESLWPLTCTGSAQERGSELTYARRYTLEGLIGVAATEDDDGSSASEQRGEQSQQQAPRPPRAPQQPRQQPQQRQAPPSPPATSGPQVWSEGDAAAFTSAVKAEGWTYQEVCDAIQAQSAEGRRPSEMTLEQRQRAFRWLQTEEGQEALVSAGERRGRVLEDYKAIPRGERATIAEKLGIEHKAPSAQRTDRMVRIIDAHAQGADLAQGGES